MQRQLAHWKVDDAAAAVVSSLLHAGTVCRVGGTELNKKSGIISDRAAAAEASDKTKKLARRSFL